MITSVWLTWLFISASLGAPSPRGLDPIRQAFASAKANQNRAHQTTGVKQLHQTTSVKQPHPTTSAKDHSPAPGAKTPTKEEKARIKTKNRTGNWLNISCNRDDVSNQAPKNMSQRYVDAQVREFWTDYQYDWDHIDQSQFSPPRTFTTYFTNQLSQAGNCAVMNEPGSPGCEVIKCSDIGVAGPMLAWNSLAILNSFITAVWYGLQQARDLLDIQGLITDTTSIDSFKMTKDNLDIFLMLTLALVPVGFSALGLVGEGAATVAGTAAAKAAAKAKTAKMAPQDAANQVVVSGARQNGNDVPTPKGEGVLPGQSVTSKLGTTFAESGLIGAAVGAHNFIENALPAATQADAALALDSQLSNYLNVTKLGLDHFLSNITHGNKGYRDVLTNMIVTGELDAAWQQNTYKIESDAFKGLANAAQTKLATQLAGSVLPFLWKAPYKDGKSQTPFVFRVDRKFYKCKDPVSTADEASGLQYMNDDTKDKTIWCDGQGNSFFLLSYFDLTQDSCTSQKGSDGKPKKCYPLQPLIGGTDDVLKKYGLSIKDIVLATWAGFVVNDDKNGYSPQSLESVTILENGTLALTQFPWQGGVRVPGFFNLTMCVTLGRMRDDAGLTTKWDSTPCEDPQSLDDVSGDKNSDGFTPGNCAVHVTHWRPLGDGTKHGNNNQLDKHQLGIMIRDGTNKQMMFAPKQPVMGTLSAHTSLGPLNVTVDDDTIHFFHGNQHWTEDSKDHQCSFPKAKWDGDTETKSGSCIYHCESPSESVPDDLDSKDLQVTPIQKAYDGNGGNPNMHFADDYRKGWCTFHLRVYQRNEDNEDLNPSSFYAMEIALYDAGDDDNDAKIVAYQSQTFAEKSVNIQGPLPYELIATPPKDDDDHVYFKYAGASFHTGDKKNCGNCGAYDSGAMDCDCGFTC